MAKKINIRGNICVRDRFGGSIYLYTHKRGFDTFEILRNAIVRGVERIQDEQYFTRVIFSEMIKDTNLNDVNDYGISTFVGENDIPIFVVDIKNCRILMEEGRYLATCPCLGFFWSYQQFLELKQDPRIQWLKDAYNIKDESNEK